MLEPCGVNGQPAVYVSKGELHERFGLDLSETQPDHIPPEEHVYLTWYWEDRYCNGHIRVHRIDLDDPGNVYYQSRVHTIDLPHGVRVQEKWDEIMVEAIRTYRTAVAHTMQPSHADAKGA